MNKLINTIGFQLGWWLLIVGVSQGFEVAAIVLCGIWAGIQLRLSKRPSQELKLCAFALIIGVALDTSMQHLSVIDFYGWSLRGLSPFWLWMLWIMFALTLNASLDFLKNQPLALSAALGLVFGPLTYYAGASLGVADFKASPAGIFILALSWMIAMPSMVMAAKHTSRTPEDTPP